MQVKHVKSQAVEEFICILVPSLLNSISNLQVHTETPLANMLQAFDAMVHCVK